MAESRPKIFHKKAILKKLDKILKKRSAVFCKFAKIVLHCMFFREFCEIF